MKSNYILLLLLYNDNPPRSLKSFQNVDQCWQMFLSTCTLATSKLFYHPQNSCFFSISKVGGWYLYEFMDCSNSLCSVNHYLYTYLQWLIDPEKIRNVQLSFRPDSLTSTRDAYLMSHVASYTIEWLFFW